MQNKIIIFSFITVISCKNVSDTAVSAKTISNENANPDFFVEFFYLDEGAMYPMSFGCGRLQSGNENYKTNYLKIIDKEFTEKVKAYYSNLKDDRDKDFNARIHFLVHTKGIVDSLCMGGYYGIVVNGASKEDSKEFLEFIKTNIYKNN